MLWPLVAAKKGQDSIDLGGIDGTLDKCHRQDLAGELQSARARIGVSALA
jgi:hypothetical protein